MVNILICSGSYQEAEEIREKALHHYMDQIKAVIWFKEKEALFFHIEECTSERSILIIEIEFCNDGIKIAEKAKSIDPWAEVIFICKKDKWTLDVYEVDHAYGLEYPLSDEKVKCAINRTIDRIDEKRNTLFPIKKKGIIYALDIKKIQYLEQEKRKIHIHTEGEIHSVYVKFSDIEKYKTDYFARCHSSYAVNLYFVLSISESHFMMKNGAKVPISRSRMRETREIYEAFIAGS